MPSRVSTERLATSSSRQRSDDLSICGLERHTYVLSYSLSISLTLEQMILQLIPVLSIFFLLTSAAGSALWAVHIESENADNLVNEREEEDALSTPNYIDEP